jgi:hypothetical protein
VVNSRRDESAGIAITVRHLELLPAREESADFYLKLGGRGRFFR